MKDKPQQASLFDAPDPPTPTTLPQDAPKAAEPVQEPAATWAASIELFFSGGR